MLSRMNYSITRTTHRIFLASVAGALIVTTPMPAMAQDDEISESRLRKIESEVRALQRRVFPGGDGRFFEPQIAPDSQPGPVTVDPSSMPSTSALTGVLARLDALETQIQQLTARSEENSYAMRLMDERLSALEQAQIAAAAQATRNAAEQEAAAQDAAPDTDPDTGTVDDDDTTSADAADADPEEAAAPSADRLAAVQEITKPQTDDAADDEYSYGFRLWNAGFYPEARQQLNGFLEDHSDHWRATWARNLLGRAYLDDGMASEAARWFLRNWQADQQAPRAPDSLLFLSEAMIALEDTRRACIALAEFGEMYPAVATGRLADQYESNRRKVTCN